MKKIILLLFILVIWIINFSYWFILTDSDYLYWYILDQDNNLIKYNKENKELIKIWTNYKSFSTNLTKYELSNIFYKDDGYKKYKIYPSFKNKKVNIPFDFLDLVNYIQTSKKTRDLVHSILEEFNKNNISNNIFYIETYDPYYDYLKINNYNFYLTLDFSDITTDLGEDITTDFKENKIKELRIIHTNNIKNNFTFSWNFKNLTKIILEITNKNWTISFDWTYNNYLTVKWIWGGKVDFSKIEDKIKELEIENAPWYLNLWNYNNLTKLSIVNWYNSVLLDKNIINLSNKLQYLKFKDNWHNYEIDYSKMNDDDSFTIPWTDNGVDCNYNIIIKKWSSWLLITAEKIEKNLPFYDKNFKNCLDNKYNVFDSIGNNIDLDFVEDKDDDWKTIRKISNIEQVDKVVKIDCSKYSITDLRWINNFQNLEDLKLGGRSSYYYKSETADLSWLKKLKSVSIINNYPALNNISLPDSIENLTLWKTNFDNLDFLKNLHNLKNIYIEYNKKTININNNLPKSLQKIQVRSKGVNFKISEVNNTNLPNLKTLSLYNESTIISPNWLYIDKDLDNLHIENLKIWYIYWNIKNFRYNVYNIDTDIDIIWNWNIIENFWIYNSYNKKISLYYNNVTIKNFWISGWFYSTKNNSSKYMMYKIPIIDSDNDWKIDSYFKLSSSNSKIISDPFHSSWRITVRPVISTLLFWNKYEISSDIVYNLFKYWTIKEWNKERQEWYAIFFDKENNKYYYVDNEVSITNITYMNADNYSWDNFFDISWLWNFFWLTFLKIKLDNSVKWLDELYNLTNMKEAYFYKSPWLTDTKYLKNMNKLEKLAITYTYKNINLEWLQYLTNLTHLDLRSNKIDNLPSNIWNLTNLTYLNLGSNKISSLPSEMWNLTNLKYLNLYNNELTEVPDLGLAAKNFTTSYCYSSSNAIILCKNKISNADNLSKYTNLDKIDLGYNSLTAFNPDLSSLSNLVYIDLRYNNLKSLWNNILSLDWKIKFLYLYWNPNLKNFNRNFYYSDKNIYSENILDTNWDGEPDTNLTVKGDGNYLRIYK